VHRNFLKAFGLSGSKGLDRGSFIVAGAPPETGIKPGSAPLAEVKPGAVLWVGGLGIYEFPKRLATRFNMKKATSIPNNVCCTSLLSGICVFCIVALGTKKRRLLNAQSLVFQWV